MLNMLTCIMLDGNQYLSRSPNYALRGSYINQITTWFKLASFATNE